MRYFIPQCRYCKYSKPDCKTKIEIKDFFKNANVGQVSSVRVKCKDFKPIAKTGDIIEFEMCGNILKRPVLYVENNSKTFIVLTAKDERNKELFTFTVSDFMGEERHKKYYNEEEDHNINNNLMIGFVNYKYIKRVIKNVNIPKMSWGHEINSNLMSFINRKDS